MIKWFRSILVIGVIAIFASMTATAQEDGGALVPGEEVDVEVDGEDALVFTYEASAGEVISILVEAEDGTDTVMTIYDADGDEVARDDDSGPSLNPAFIRLELPDDGEYTIEITPYSDDEPLDDEFEVTLFQTELLDLNAGPQTTVVGDDFEIDRMAFEAEEDVVYAVLVTVADDYSSTLYIDLLEEDQSFASRRARMNGTLELGFIFEADDDGIIIFELEYFGFNDEAEVTVTVESQ
ncbi:MAG: hypothetical protein ACFE0Q_00195 [Anaerolineae bacterium]